MTYFDPATAPQFFTDIDSALQRLAEIYNGNTAYLRDGFQAYAAGATQDSGKAQRISACYPYVALTTDKHAEADSRLAYGYLPGPGRYATTVTRPDLFARYHREQFARLLAHAAGPIEVGVSTVPIPLHFAWPEGLHIEGELAASHMRALPDQFDVPNLAHMDDRIANGILPGRAGDAQPLSLFEAPRVDYSLHRLRHYTATGPAEFQNFIIFTNYQFYVDEFIRYGAELMQTSGHDYISFVAPGNNSAGHTILRGGDKRGVAASRLPQMPAYHLQKADSGGITLVNIGVGPSNAKTITDHLAVLRPHAWLMVGHCAGLRASQRLGDYVLAHAYVRDDHVLDADLPLWVPIPALSEMQLALEASVTEVSGREGYDLKSIMRTGTVATTDNRNWELRGWGELASRFAQSRAIALDMESATIAANGFRFRVPYGTLLCVSDKPLHGEIKLPGMADRFYRERVAQHLKVGIRALEKLAELGPDKLHSRKLRGLFETAFQ